ncbi:MAG: hypothetical protein KBG73_01020 [Candidatus Promineofilum sp.]|nr:hypothetical protein [Promineifilum sp.]
MKGQSIVGTIVVGLLLLGAGFAGGMAWTAHRLGGERLTADPSTVAAASPVESVTPTTEVPGADVPGLPRFPGANRVEYRQSLAGDFRETEVEYVVADDLSVVHDFYRDMFDREGWRVADLGVYQGEWTFFVIKDGREALMEIESRGALIEIEIEITEPLDVLGETADD